ncbi:tRNA methyltransferase 10 homolog B [Caerostris extrusa]|uniref:tRNA methyltransferase 10 homolog B n=1 Tax=Caerostris extrusa TaxID=172846 RepID=A0AAV4UR29_CAEEX|nr:tRNA methyltransferase 10 homolog B [Caerostris extrusa]
MSKKKQRKARHHERVVAAIKDKRKLKKMRRKEKISEMKKLQPVPVKEDLGDKKKNLTKKEQKMLIKERLLMAQGIAPKICINLGFASAMEPKELTRLSSQLRRLYGTNRHSSTPVHLIPNILEKLKVDMTADAPEDLFELNDIIYLSPDSENVLETLIQKKSDLSLNHAKNFNIKTARLPIIEHLVPFSTNPGTTVLTVNQVFDILLKYYETKDWVESLSCYVPFRKGYCPPSKKEELSRNLMENRPSDSSIQTGVKNISNSNS